VTSGAVTLLAEPLSFWGGVDPATGRIIDVHHPQHGADLAGRVVVMPGGRGSSSSASVLAESVRAGTAPAALILGEPDLILAIGAAVAAELYGVTIPVLVDPSAAGGLEEGEVVEVDERGWSRGLP
jgi:predicted aconitase with swiveling domain